MLFRLWGILPKEAGIQNPFVLFRLLEGMEGTVEESPSDFEMNEHLKMFYGQ